MIANGETLDAGAVLEADVAVIGSGPAGITTALELENYGLKVLVIESGHRRFDSVTQELGEATIEDPARHAPMSMTTRRVLGGASSVWGGRCVPFDRVDFRERPFVDGVWPVSADELSPLYDRACELLFCGRAAFDQAEMPHLPPSIVPGLADGDVLTSTFERWSLPTDFGKVYYARLERSQDVRVVTGLTCTRVVLEPSDVAVKSLEARTLSGKSISVKARAYVVACGGLEATRLLLASTDSHGRAVGDHSGNLGRWYMGHLEGSIANIRFKTPAHDTIYGYERDTDGVYVRRRISVHEDAQLREQLPNVVGWLANPNLPDASHHDGALSLAYLILASPVGGLFSPPAQRAAMTGQRVPGVPYGPVRRSPVREHLRNVIRDPRGALGFAFDFGYKRFVTRGRRAPGFFVERADNVYPLQFHGEHLPSFDSRVFLNDSRDALGMPRLSIDVRFSEADVDGILRAHEKWDEHLRVQGIGELEYVGGDPAASVANCLGAGFHQSGTTRMSEDPNDGVLTRDLAVHGFDDLYVVSSSAFVTSGQANSTFMIVVFAIRLAERLRSQLASSRCLRENVRVAARRKGATGVPYVDDGWGGPAIVRSIELTDPPASIPLPSGRSRAVVFFRDHGVPVYRTELAAAHGVILEGDYQRSLQAARDAADAVGPRIRPVVSGDRPSISVAVCTRDRADAAMATIRSIEAARYDGELQILLIDNAPTDDSLERAVAAHRAESGSSVQRIVEPIAGLSRARNRALASGSGELIAFTDDDALVEPGWLEAIAAAFASNPAIGGVTGIALPAEIDTRAQDLAERFNGLNAGRGFESHVYNRSTLGARHVLYPFPTFGAGVNMAFRRDALLSVGGFCEALGVGTGTGGGEDTAVFVDILLAGYDIVFEPASVVHHVHRRDTRDLMAQMRGYGIGVTAYLTWCLHRHPRESIGLVTMVRPALTYLRSGGRSHQDESRETVPDFLRREVRSGLPHGPMAYVRAAIRQKRRRA